jgi:hypothetical protein
VKVNQRGFIEVDRQMRTVEPSIFAIGDVVGDPMLAHNLAAMLKAAQAQNSNVGMLAPLGRWEDERSPDIDDLVQIVLVAGARNQHYLQLWRPAA